MHYPPLWVSKKEKRLYDTRYTKQSRRKKNVFLGVFFFLIPRRVFHPLFFFFFAAGVLLLPMKGLNFEGEGGLLCKALVPTTAQQCTLREFSGQPMTYVHRPSFP